MTRKTALLAAATLGLAVSFGSAPATAQSIDTIYMQTPGEFKAGRRALRQDQPEQAIRLLERGLKGNLSSGLRVVGLNDLCIAYRLQGDLEAAEEACSQAIAISPRYWRAYNNRANIHIDQDNFLAALADYEVAQELNPKSNLVRQNLRSVEALVTSAR